MQALCPSLCARDFAVLPEGPEQRIPSLRTSYQIGVTAGPDNGVSQADDLAGVVTAAAPTGTLEASNDSNSIQGTTVDAARARRLAAGVGETHPLEAHGETAKLAAANSAVVAHLEVVKQQESVREAAAVATAVAAAETAANDKATLLDAAHNSAIVNAGAAAAGVAVGAAAITAGTVTAGAQTLANAGLGSGGLEQAAGHQSEARQQIQEVAAVATQSAEDLRALATAPPPPAAGKRSWAPTPKLPRFYDKPLYSDRLKYDPFPPKIDRKKLEYKYDDVLCSIL